MFEPGRDMEAMAALGFSPDDFGDDDFFDVWPENWGAFTLFEKVATQWRAGAMGALGLDYTVLFRLMDRKGLEGNEWDEMLDDIQVMEHAALRAMRTEQG